MSGNLKFYKRNYLDFAPTHWEPRMEPESGRWLQKVLLDDFNPLILIISWLQRKRLANFFLRTVNQYFVRET